MPIEFLGCSAKPNWLRLSRDVIYRVEEANHVFMRHSALRERHFVKRIPIPFLISP
jgi:hypothetical protein